MPDRKSPTAMIPVPIRKSIERILFPTSTISDENAAELHPNGTFFPNLPNEQKTSKLKGSFLFELPSSLEKNRAFLVALASPNIQRDAQAEKPEHETLAETTEHVTSDIASAPSSPNLMVEESEAPAELFPSCSAGTSPSQVSLLRFQPTKVPNESIIAAVYRLASQHLVSDLVSTNGDPPKAVVQDWKDQIHDLNVSNVSSNLTLVSEDGTLVPFGVHWKQWCRDHGYSEFELNANQIQEAGIEVASFPCDWFDELSHIDEARAVGSNSSDAPESSESTPFAFAKSTATAVRKRSKGSRKLAVGGLALGGIVLASATWLGLSGGLSQTDTITSKATLKPTPSNAIAESQSEETATSTSASTTNAEIATTEDIERLSLQTIDLSMSPDGPEDTKEVTLESLLATIQSKPLDGFVPSTASQEGLSSTDSASLALNDPQAQIPFDANSSPMAMAMNAIAAEQPLPTTSNELDAKTMETQELKPIKNENGQLSLTQSIKPDSSLKRFTVLMGSPIVTKSCVCEVELKLDSKSVVVEPADKVSIDEEGKATWRIAIEDEEPELILIVFSRPGAKWQVTTALGLKTTAASVPILLGPNDAQMVLTRMGAQKQLLRNQIAILETARTMPKRKTRIDFFTEIKNRERAERDIDQAIEQWKTIAKLSSFYYTYAELQLKFLGESRSKTN